MPAHLHVARTADRRRDQRVDRVLERPATGEAQGAEDRCGADARGDRKDHQLLLVVQHEVEVGRLERVDDQRERAQRGDRRLRVCDQDAEDAGDEEKADAVEEIGY